ncbi:MAG: M67 family metallopeptidase [Prevotellaceae bacterium]|jgi:proteasome lid subunit RPN8/RPN11|nr:M67 family metallopeptidase [Prevotellaceae bacterium]
MIAIPQSILDGLAAHALRELPNEACGLLAGSGSAVSAHYPMVNVDRSPEHFSLDPSEHFRVLREARSHGWQIVASYHSHPQSPARPSEEDVRLAYDPDITYIILSLQERENPDVKAFSIRDGKVEPVEIVSDKP